MIHSSFEKSSSLFNTQNNPVLGTFKAYSDRVMLKYHWGVDLSSSKVVECTDHVAYPGKPGGPVVRDPAKDRRKKAALEIFGPSPVPVSQLPDDTTNLPSFVCLRLSSSNLNQVEDLLVDLATKRNLDRPKRLLDLSNDSRLYRPSPFS